MAIVSLQSISVSVQGQDVFQQLYSFSTSSSGPQHPATILTEGGSGDFYGVTVYGGSNHNSSALGDGTFFKVTKAGALTVLFSFNATNGCKPSGGMVFGNDGNLYGVTKNGGTNYQGQFGASGNFGTAFKVTTNGGLTSLFSFKGTNGNGPSGPLIFGGGGDFFGTTASGGAFGLGTVFKVTSNGNFTLLFSFNGTNGSSPNGKLARANDGLFYGTTLYGGNNFSGPATGKGTVFRITTNGALNTLVYFNGTNGSAPQSGLATGSDGNLWGTAGGTIYQITTSGLLTTILTFDGTNGSSVFGGLVQGLDGSFYGTTAYRTGSPVNYGTIYKATMTGALITLVFLNGTNGIHPFTDMTLGSDGNFYGAMADATLANAGGIYRIFQAPILTAVQIKGGVKLNWSSFSNGVYRVEYKSSLTDSGWSSLISNLAATGSTTSYTDTFVNVTSRFYRVGLVP